MTSPSVKADDGLGCCPLTAAHGHSATGRARLLHRLPAEPRPDHHRRRGHGLVDADFDQRIHYTGAINGGMSGGPGTGCRWRRVRHQRIGDHGPAAGGFRGARAAYRTFSWGARRRHWEGFTAHSRRATWWRSRRALQHEAVGTRTRVVAAGDAGGVRFHLAERGWARAFECSTTGASEAPQRLQVETIRCARAGDGRCRLDLEVGRVEFQHRVLRAQGLRALQFSQRLNDIAAGCARAGSAQQRCALRLPRRTGRTGRLRRAGQHLRAAIPACSAGCTTSPSPSPASTAPKRRW